tara:strand:- start:271 stop:540 length:270 start_codon:yes stop_codon:yes gene_type:complete
MIIISFPAATSTVVATLKGHAKRVSAVVVHPSAATPFVVSASHDATVRVWAEGAKGKWSQLSSVALDGANFISFSENSPSPLKFKYQLI